MKLLLEFGANVNAEDSEKWTPLHAGLFRAQALVYKFYKFLYFYYPTYFSCYLWSFAPRKISNQQV